ncbi:MAG TPA: aspartate dehydrogenase [Burkholderiales bacterium]|nr:aspartate dehydrogenase [Burkholderiales bacterium]
MRIGLAGLGAIGSRVAQRLEQGLDGLVLAGIAVRDEKAAQAKRAALGLRAPLVPLEQLCLRVDALLDCASPAAFAGIAAAAIGARTMLVTVNAATLLEHMDLVERARAAGTRIIVPTGALLGFDAVRAAAEGSIRSVRMITRKPPKSLAAALREQGREPSAQAERVFAGSARDAARAFPSNVNVAAALSLAGIGPDGTEVEIWSDPAVERNTHTVEVDAEAARFTMTIAGVPSPENPATGLLTPLSVIACLRGLVSPLKIGS